MKSRVMKALVFFMVCLSILSVAGCSSKDADKTEYADAAFIQSLAKGLEARWKLTDSNEEKETTVAMMTSYIQAELDELTPYESAKFEDTKLQEKAIKYINCLKESKEHVEYYFSNDIKENEKWQEVYDTRTLLIKDFVENYHLTVDKKYQSTLDEFLVNGKTVESKSAEKETIEKLVSSLDFKVKDDSSDWKTYRAVLDNTTKYNIKSLSVDISLYDENGVIVNTEYAHAENVKKGQKAYMEFSSDESFEKMEIILDYYEVE